jgi:hypothetical protein
MSKSMHVIAGTGLDQKTRKSHWPARLGFVQSASGFFLGNVDRVSPEENGHGGMEIGTVSVVSVGPMEIDRGCIPLVGWVRHSK